jgi:hypothetical protein
VDEGLGLLLELGLIVGLEQMLKLFQGVLARKPAPDLAHHL